MSDGPPTSNWRQSRFWRLYSFKGRVGRPEFLMLLICYAVVMLMFNTTLDNMNSYAYYRGGNEQVFSFALVVILLIVFVPAALAVTCRRCHDVGWSGWLQVVSVIPLINIGFALYLLLKPGDKGPNEFGPPPDSKRE